MLLCSLIVSLWAKKVFIFFCDIGSDLLLFLALLHMFGCLCFFHPYLADFMDIFVFYYLYVFYAPLEGVCCYGCLFHLCSCFYALVLYIRTFSLFLLLLLHVELGHIFYIFNRIDAGVESPSHLIVYIYFLFLLNILFFHFSLYKN